MATPWGTQENSLPATPSGMGPLSDFSDASNPRKRNREALDDSFDDGILDLTDDGRPKTRRVNPQRLAIRLGPDLVAEMEALIVPGAKMPNFTVRKDFQERYNVDRRHIYDYFHSRGLRVAKEDKHTNLIRGRAMKAQAQLQAIPKVGWPPAPAPVKQESPTCDAPLPRPFLVESAPPKSRGKTAKRQIKVEDRKPRSIMRRPTPQSSRALKLLQDFDFSAAQPLAGDTSGPCITTSSSGTDTDWESTSTCPQFTLPNDSSDDNIDETSVLSDFLHSPDDFVAGYFDSPSVHAQQSFLDSESGTACDPGLDSLISFDDHRLLTQDERTELYDLINNNIPRARGLEEHAGTYNNYMNERSWSYFDRLLPVTRHGRSWKVGVHANNSSTATCDSPMSVDIPDLRKWLSDDLDLYQLAMNVPEYNPIRDSLEENFALADISTGTSGGSDLTGENLAPLQSQNRMLSGNMMKGSEKVSKQDIKGSGYNLENLRPSLA
ncbi:hypothetical protein BDZ97DRAFT_1919453 [Flammula alnicola]|nr:hypothetical protein BDZ97DRAFT_1919453 [Flammula alnicola]